MKTFSKTIVMLISSTSFLLAQNDCKGLFEKFLNTKDTAEKRYFLEDISKKCPETEYDYFSKGYYENQNNNHKKAIIFYTKVIEINPNLDDTYYNRGIAYFNMGNYSSAINDFTKEIAYNPGYAKTYYSRGEL